MENGGCETGAPFEIVTMINRVGIVYLGGASPSTLAHTHGRNYIFPGCGYAPAGAGARARALVWVTARDSGREGTGGCCTATSHRSVYICRFRRVLIGRTHAATLSCTLGEQCRARACINGMRAADPRSSIRAEAGLEISAYARAHEVFSDGIEIYVVRFLTRSLSSQRRRKDPSTFADRIGIARIYRYKYL